MSDRVIAIIPARGGSKRLPRKNIKMLAGKPMIQWTIEAARECKQIGRIIVSTEDAEIASISDSLGAEVIERPMELARDDTPTWPVIMEVLCQLDYHGSFLVMQPNVPIRPLYCANHCAWPLILQDDAMVITVSAKTLQPDGACYGFTDRSFRNFMVGAPVPLVTLVSQDGMTVDIDTQEDFDRAEAILLRRGK